MQVYCLRQDLRLMASIETDHIKTEPATECSSFSYYAEGGCNEWTSSIICEKNASMRDACSGIEGYS